MTTIDDREVAPEHLDTYWLGRLSVALEGILEVILDDEYPDELQRIRTRLCARSLVAYWDDQPSNPAMTSEAVQAMVRDYAANCEVTA